MFWILINLSFFALNMFACGGDLLTTNGAIGVVNLFLAGVFIGGIK